MSEEIEERRVSHVEICVGKKVSAKHITTLFEDVHLVHNPLPEMDLEDVNPSVSLFGRRFSLPICIDSITGGAAEVSRISRNLAEAAEVLGIPMFTGSMRNALYSEEVARSFRAIREVAPSAFIGANIGAPQLSKGLKVEEVERLIDLLRADALVVHLNPLQELIQPEGEPYYRNVLAAISNLVKSLKAPVIVKETGAGISREAYSKLAVIGVAAVNVAGAGGTSWAAVEHYRAHEVGALEKARLGELLWDWGIPTALCLLELKGVSPGVPIIASGGIRTGLDVVKAIVLGASSTALALPLLRPAMSSSGDVVREIKRLEHELKAVMFLTGSKDVPSLGNVRYYVTGRLRELWRGGSS